MVDEKPKAGPPETVFVRWDDYGGLIAYDDEEFEASHGYILASVAEARIRELEEALNQIAENCEGVVRGDGLPHFSRQDIADAAATTARAAVARAHAMRDSDAEKALAEARGK